MGACSNVFVPIKLCLLLIVYMHNSTHAVVGIDFTTMDVTVNENNGTVTVCLMKNITTDGPIVIVFDAEEESGVSNPASSEY